MPSKRHYPQMQQVNALTSEGKSVHQRREWQDDDHVFTLLPLLWRRSGLIAGFCLVGVVLAALIAGLVPNRYTADAVIKARLFSADQAGQSGIALNAGSMIETEARLLATSRPIAHRVVARIALTDDPSFAFHTSLSARARDLLTSVWPTFDNRPARSKENLIVDELMRNLTVTNDLRSYLIKISYTSTSPEQSAQIANAFAEEYIRARRESSALQELEDLAAKYGPKHPKSLVARAELEQGSRSDMGDDPQLLLRAEPPDIPSTPDWRLVLGLAFVGSFAAAILFVFMREHIALSKKEGSYS